MRDWRSGNKYSNTEREQIDLGVRVGVLPDNDLIVKPIAPLRLQTVMAPALRKELGQPKSIGDLDSGQGSIPRLRMTPAARP